MKDSTVQLLVLLHHTVMLSYQTRTSYVSLTIHIHPQ